MFPTRCWCHPFLALTSELCCQTADSPEALVHPARQIQQQNYQQRHGKWRTPPSSPMAGFPICLQETKMMLCLHQSIDQNGLQYDLSICRHEHTKDLWRRTRERDMPDCREEDQIKGEQREERLYKIQALLCLSRWSGVSWPSPWYASLCMQGYMHAGC